MKRSLTKTVLPIFVALMLASATFAVNRLITDGQTNRIKSETETYAKGFSAKLESRVQVRLGVVSLIEQHWESGLINNFEQFRAEADAVHNLFGDIQALNWISSAGVIEVTTPMKGNEAALGLDIRSLSVPALALAEAERTGEIAFTAPISLAQGGVGFVAYLPISREQQIVGYLNIVFRSAPMIRSAMKEDQHKLYQIWVNDEGAPLFGTSLPDIPPAHSINTIVNVGSRSWNVLIAPTPTKLDLTKSYIDEVVLFSGLFLSVVIAFLSYLAVARQRSLKESEERFAFAMKGANDGLWDWNLKSGEIYFSPRWFEMLGYRFGELSSTHDVFLTLLHPEEKKSVAAYPEKVISSGNDVSETEFRMRHKNGSWVSILSRAFLIRENDEVVRIVGTHVDITERKKSEDSLKRAQVILREGLEALPIGFAFYDDDQKLLVFNQNFPKLISSGPLKAKTGMTSEEIMSESPAFVEARNEEGISTSLSISPAEWSYQRSDRRWITVIERPAKGGGFIQVFEDITDARLNHERLQRTQNLEAVGQLTGGVAHDFNNLLAVIMGNLQLLRDDLSNQDHLNMIDAGVKATLRGADLTQKMLAFAGKAPLSPETIDLNCLVAETRDWAGRTLPANISFEASLQTGLWPIEADAGSTESALLNLILNARDAMPEGGQLLLETANIRADQSYVDSRGLSLEPGQYVLLTVTDTGCGIPTDAIAQVFEPFYSTKPPGAGSGLGLSMIQGFMEQSSGTVRVFSELGVGTSFELYFRSLGSDAHIVFADQSEFKEQRSVGRRVLVVEDEPEVLAVVVAMLKKAGYSVVSAFSGDEAKKVFEADPSFDLLLTDIMMPGTLQGIALSEVLRELNSDLRVIFMSGYASEAPVSENRLNSEDIRLMKPVTRSGLLDALEASLGVNRSS